MAQADLEELMNFLIPFAQQMLAKSGEFFPFAAAMKQDGTIAQIMSYDGNEQPVSDDLIAILMDGFREDASKGELRATGICYDVRVAFGSSTNKTDAICVWLEHSDGEAKIIYLPYHKDSFGALEYGDLKMTLAEKKVFSPLGGAT
jgi:hypothetical protein